MLFLVASIFIVYSLMKHAVSDLLLLSFLPFSIIKGKENIQPKVIELFRSGENTQKIAQTLQIPVTSVRDYLRKGNLGRKDMLSVRNQKIEKLLKQEGEYATLNLKFESVANKLKDEYPNLTAKQVYTYYYVHFLKK